MNQLINAHILPQNDKEKMIKGLEDHRLLTIQLSIAKRDVTIEFVDGTIKTYEDIDLAIQEGDFFTFFSKKDSLLYKFPNCSINHIIQKIK